LSKPIVSTAELVIISLALEHCIFHTTLYGIDHFCVIVKKLNASKP
jgi:hypothetical protein